MTEFSRYLAEEVAIDFGDGVIDRREALRRLALLGVGLGAASALLAACSTDGSPAATGGSPAASGGAGPAQPSSAAAGATGTPTEAITFAGPDGRTLRGAWAAAANPRGTVLVIHENRGLTEHIRSVAGRLAASGFAALAIDLLSAEGGTERFTDPASATAALNAAPDERFVADMKAGVGELLRRVPDGKPGAVGFCFGGGMVWSLLAAGEPRLAAAAPFYGPLPGGADFAGSRSAAVLAVYAEQDGRVNASRDAAQAALRKAGLTHEVVTVPGVDHAFFNDTGPRYNAQAAASIYQKLTDWLGTHLAR
jgi:carboxymethylenebutenolidase